MTTAKTTERAEGAAATAGEARTEVRSGAREYQTPELFVVGKAIELVQGGGGNYADNNRSRQY
jgi:hypothetical protein